jgi:uncharacterized protein (DUF58 family)
VKIRTVPNWNAVVLAALPAGLSLSVLFAQTALYPILVLDGVLLSLLIVDYFTLPKRADFAVERDLQHTLALGRFYPVTITVTNRLERDVPLHVNDDLPDVAETTGAPARFRLAPRSRVSFDYRLALHSRGSHRLDCVYLRVPSRVGLWQRILTYPETAVLNVYPDVQQMTDYLALARHHQVSLMGIRQLHRSGGDNEFERLKEYQADDEFRHVAWRATARQGRLITKMFQMNENQSVIFMLDCGRMMLGQVRSARRVDCALNTILMLAHIALHNHDKVGLVTFAGEVVSYLPPKGGHSQMQRLIHASYDKFALDQPSDFRAALGYLNGKWRRRSLLILISQAIDDLTFADLKKYFAPLLNRHLPLLVLLRDRDIEDMAAAQPSSNAAFYRTAAAAEYLTWRQRHIDDLRRTGVLCLDVHPDNLNSLLINEYLRIKAEHLL